MQGLAGSVLLHSTRKEKLLEVVWFNPETYLTRITSAAKATAEKCEGLQCPPVYFSLRGKTEQEMHGNNECEILLQLIQSVGPVQKCELSLSWSCAAPSQFEGCLERTKSLAIS